MNRQFRFRALASVAVFVPAAIAILVFSRPVRAQISCYQQTGFCLANDQFAEYFYARGGVTTFGYPISREFLLEGFQVQFFQGHVMQLNAQAGVTTLNLLQDDVMPVTRGYGLVLPPPDPKLLGGAPQVRDSDYSSRVIPFVKQNAPDQWGSTPVNFFITFKSTVPSSTALTAAEAQAALVPLVNLEIWGLPTSPPTADPNNPAFIYQRYQRAVMHYRDTCQCTERLLLADWFKAVITGRDLPADLQDDIQQSPQGRRFLLQYDVAQANGPLRPQDLRNTDMRFAFLPDLQPAATVAPTAAPTGVGPTPTPIPSPSPSPTPIATSPADPATPTLTPEVRASATVASSATLPATPPSGAVQTPPTTPPATAPRTLTPQTTITTPTVSPTSGVAASTPSPTGTPGTATATPSATVGAPSQPPAVSVSPTVPTSPSTPPTFAATLANPVALIECALVLVMMILPGVGLLLTA